MIFLMIVAVDVLYSESTALVAAVVFQQWDAKESLATYTLKREGVAEYIPGKFYLRELEPIKAVLTRVGNVDTVVIDGYCYLDESGQKGLGAHLYDATAGKYTIVGVAKNSFKGSPHAVPVCRGDSKKPLFITSVGMPQEQAADYISHMSGDFRMPTLLKKVDSMTRGLRE